MNDTTTDRWCKKATKTPVGFVKHNGAGEIVFRQAGHPTNDAHLGFEWTPVFTELGR